MIPIKLFIEHEFFGVTTEALIIYSEELIALLKAAPENNTLYHIEQMQHHTRLWTPTGWDHYQKRIIPIKSKTELLLELTAAMAKGDVNEITRIRKQLET